MKVVEAHLATLDYSTVEWVLVVVHTEEHRLGWFVYVQTEQFARTGLQKYVVAGPGYYLVDGVDGSLHHMHATADQTDGDWIDDYLAEVRGAGLPNPSPPTFAVRRRVTGPNPEPGR